MGNSTPQNDPSAAALTKLRELLRRADLAEADGRSAQGVAWDETKLPPAALDPSRHLLQQAETSGAIRLEHHSGFRSGICRRIVLVDADALARFVGQIRLATQTALIEAAIAPALEGAPDWLNAIADRCLTRWARNESPFGLKPDQPMPATETFLLLRAIGDERLRCTDPRTFSLTVVGRTKALEERRGAVISALRAAFSFDDGLSADDILATFGLARYQQPLLLRAPVVLPETGDTPLWFSPYIGLAPEMLEALAPTPRAPYLLIIENLTTFNRYVREVQDDGLVLYAGGFPTKLCREAACRLSAAADQAFHWGDIDAGGVRIFSLLEQTIPGLRPHMMNEDLARRHGKETDGEPSLGVLGNSNSAIAALARFLSGERTWQLEQEGLPPIAPSLCNG